MKTINTITSTVIKKERKNKSNIINRDLRTIPSTIETATKFLLYSIFAGRKKVLTRSESERKFAK